MDSTSESAVRVIATFDDLIAHRASADALLRTAAALAGCPAGLAEVGRAPLRYNPLGQRMAAVRARPSIERDLFLDDARAGRTWLEREGQSGELDEIVIERMKIAAEAILERTQRGTGADRRYPPAIDVLLDPNATAAETRHAARTLQLDPREPARAVLVSAVTGLDELATSAARSISGPAASAWSMSGDWAVMITQDQDVEPRLAAVAGVAAVAVGTQRAIDVVRDSYDAASVALRFARPGAPIVWFEELESRSLLAELDTERVRENPDVGAMQRLARGPNEPSDISIVKALCRMGTLRGAAAEVHLHHSSIAHRLRNIEDVLGYSLGSPHGLYRAKLALDLWELSEPAERAEDEM